MTRLRLETRIFLAIALAGAAVVGACNINPQPLPPEALSNPGGGGSDNSRGDGSTGFGPGADAAPPATPDGGHGDAGGGYPDGGDAGTDGDAAMDAPDDAPTDATEDG